MWPYYAIDQSPAAVATVFAASQFDPPREVRRVYGSWSPGGLYEGRFTLRGGMREYRISGVSGSWIVTPIEAGTE